MCTFANATCGGFEAGASRGFLSANVTNTGALAATYTLAVSNCSVAVRPVEAQRLALPPGAPTPVAPFQIYVEDGAANASRYCWLALFDSQV